MGKIGIIIAREYLYRIKNKWFIIMTFIGPILLAALMVLPVWLAVQENKSQKILVVDETHLFADSLKSDEIVQFVTIASTKEQGDILVKTGDYTGMLYIPQNFTKAYKVILSVKKDPPKITMDNLKKTLESKYFEMTLRANNVPDSVIKVSRTSIKIAKQKLNEHGEVDTEHETRQIMGIGLAIFIYIFILIYGMQIMRGVMEEKTNRIVEVIVSSVKPFQLLMGKIIGVAMVGLTQFLLWVILSLTLTGVLNATVFKDMIADAKVHQEQMQELERKGIETDFTKFKNPSQPIELIKEREAIANIDFGKILFTFGFYFLGGYLLFGALYAAMGSAVDSETDTQQFILPVTLPIIVSFLFAQYVIQSPHSTLSVWLSIIPFTSPIIMMVRMPFDPPAWEIAVSMATLVLGFVFTTWLAAKIYRTGILMYGKKVSWKELGKWLFYKA